MKTPGDVDDCNAAVAVVAGGGADGGFADSAAAGDGAAGDVGAAENSPVQSIRCNTGQPLWEMVSQENYVSS